MSTHGLQTLLITAVTDRALCDSLLGGAPGVYAHFELSAAERAGLQNIRALTLEDYARQAHCLFYGEDPLTGEPRTTPHRTTHCKERAMG
jgi:hypothetical protein